MEIVAQIIGIVALVAAVISFQQRTYKGILVLQLVSSGLFAFHFAMLGAYTGAVLNAIAAVRSLIYAYKGKPWADNILWFWLFCVLSVMVGVFTWNGPLSILPVLGMISTTAVFLTKTPKMVRIVSFPSSPLWLVYNIFTHSLGGVITEVISMISIIVAMIRLDFKKDNAN